MYLTTMEHLFDIITHPLLPIAIVALVFGIGLYFVFAGTKRRKELGAWAAANGFDFSTNTDDSFDYQFPNFTCINLGSDRYAKNIITGLIKNRRFFAFDYYYTTGSGKSQHQHCFSAVILQNHIWCKSLLIRPETFVDKLREFAGFHDIDFESEEFNRKFFVQSPDKKWAYDIIHPQAMDFLLKSPVFSIQFDTLYTIAWKDTTFTIDDFENALNVIHGLFDALRIAGIQRHAPFFSVLDNFN
jgi:hypothetical protein